MPQWACILQENCIYLQHWERGNGNVPSFSFIYLIKRIPKNMEERIIELLEAKFTEEEFADFFFVELTFNETNKKLEVFVDSDTSLTIGQCARLNKYLQQHIDEAGWLGEKYILDVSSPGVGKPLKLRRQYPKNVGRNLEIKLHDGETREGKLLAVNDTHITLEEKVLADPKKKKKVAIASEIAFADIKRTKVKISFK